MQTRLLERIPLNLPATILLTGKSYGGTIANVSESGIGSVITLVFDSNAEFIPAHNIDLHFKDPSGETIELVCELVWFSRNEVDPRRIAIGMRIVNPSLKYQMFIKTLFEADLMNRSKEQLIEELLEARRTIVELQTKATTE